MDERKHREEDNAIVTGDSRSVPKEEMPDLRDFNVPENTGDAPEVSDCENSNPEDVLVEEILSDAEAEKAARRKKRWKDLCSDLLFFAVSFVIIYTLFYVFPPYLVDGKSMNQTLDHRAFGFGIRYGELNRGDIVVFSNEKTDGRDYIKRIIACPGDTLRIENDEVYVNGELLLEPYAYFETVTIPGETDGKNESVVVRPEYHLNEITLGDDEYFVMGDNRYNSKDSRRIGVIHREDVKCRMLFFLWGKH